MDVEFPYGHGKVSLTVPDQRVAWHCAPQPLPRTPDPGDLLVRSIRAGMEACDLAAQARPGSRACIVVTDRTRSTPIDHIVPILLDELNSLGVPDQGVTVISGGGMHAADTRDDLARTLGEAVLSRVAVVTNEPDNDAAMVRLGTSDMGTPVEFHRHFAEADIRIGVTNVNPCMLAGWSGGGKIALPAVASRRCIYHNHKLFVQPLMELRCSSLLGVMPPLNPVRADIDQCATIGGLQMVVNTVLDSQRQLVDAFCGDPLTSHRAAIARMTPYVEVTLPQAVDVLVAGVGDPAFEVSLFQGGSRVCGGVDRYLRPGGTLVMVNACTEGIYEGFEHKEFRDWMRRMPTPAEIGRIVEAGEMGGEKGCVLLTFSWLLHELNCRIILVTDGMTDEQVHEIHMERATNAQQAVEEAMANYDGASPVGLMPHAGLVLPTLPHESK